MHPHPTGGPLLLLPQSGVGAFAASLGAKQRNALRIIQAKARQPVPGHCVAFHCGRLVLGQLLPAHAAQLATVLKNAALRDGALVWDAQEASALERSELLQSALTHLREQDLVSGWRNEEFCYWTDLEARPDPAQPAFVRIERAGFRYLGIMSHAVHINGFTPEGRMWCGLRSDSKATDPGLWDSLTAGGLSAGESLESCAVRELWEEAGLRPVDAEELHPAGPIRMSRLTPTGWHDEMLWIYNLQVSGDFIPRNQDGEVQGFACLSAAEVVESVGNGQWTMDAALALAQGVIFACDL